MAEPFSRSLRSIEADGGGYQRWLALPALLLLSTWGVWMARAEIPLLATSEAARVVREQAVYRIEGGVEGRIVRITTRLGAEVQQGTLLFELDSSAQELALAEERARAAALQGRIKTSLAVVSALERARADADRVGTAVLREARLELSSRELEFLVATEEAERLTKLESEGGVPALTVSKARTQAEKARVAVEAQGVALERLPLDARRADSDREATLAQSRSELAQHEGALEVANATIERLRHEIGRRQVRAPASGTIGELAPLSTGSFVAVDQVLGAIVGPGELTVEADFAPAVALGKVRLGQRGVLELAGFPRAEFGAIDATVTRIASEARDGLIRVELSVDDPSATRIPLQHGLPGALRVEVERASPAALVLRSVGGALGLGRGDSRE